MTPMAAPLVADTVIGDGPWEGVVTETSASPRRYLSPGCRDFLSNLASYLHIRNLNASAGSFAGLAVDPHAVVRPIQHLHTFIYVTHSDALFEQRCQASLRNADTIVLHHQMQTAVGQ